MERPIGPPPPRYEEERDHCVVLRDVPWSQYQALLDARGERPRPKLAYLDGALEVMTTSRRHELAKKLLARLLEAFAEETGVELTGAGETTFRAELKQAGLEPDECYYIDELEDFPHIALEVVHTSGGVNKLEIYRRLGVREVWFWIDGRFWLYALAGDRYVEVKQSGLLPALDFDAIARLLLTTPDREQTSTVRAYRAALRSG